jgi:hypothetical protein
MKKALISTVLLATVVIAPCFTSVLSTIDVPSRASEFACAVASPVFWHIYDEVLTRSLARITASAGQPEERCASQSDTLVCVIVQVVLTRAFDGSLTAAQKSEVMSIPSQLVRRVKERRSTAASKIPAPVRRS